MEATVIQLHKLGYCTRCKRPIGERDNVYRDETGYVTTWSHMGTCPSMRFELDGFTIERSEPDPEPPRAA